MDIIEHRTCLECGYVLNAWRTYVMVKNVIQRAIFSFSESENHFYVHTSCIPKYRMRKERG